MTRQQQTPRLRGFTTIELLVIIGILAILMGMLAVALFPSVERQNRENTKALLKKLDQSVMQQWNEALKAAQASQVPLSIKYMVYPTVPPTPEVSLRVDKIARAVWVKLVMRAEFPMTYAEANYPWAGFPAAWVPTAPNAVNQAVAYYQKALNGRTGALNPATESSALLLLALQKPRGVAGRRWSAEDALGAGAISDSDGDGMPEIVDGWRVAVGFYRWGTGNPNLDALNTSARGPTDRDREDVEHALMDLWWDQQQPSGVALFQQICHPIRNVGAAQSWYTEPVIVSAGRDGRLDLDMWMTPISGTSGSTDNIYSFKVR